MAYIALFDILGFKQTIKDLSLEELKQIMGNEFTEILDVCITYKSHKDKDVDVENSWKEHIKLGNKECSFIRFSDTILFYIEEESLLSFLHILLTSARLVSLMFLNGLPIRGAITKGELYVDDSNSLILGEGLIRALDLEKEQQWAGAIIDSERINIPHDLTDEPSSYGKQWSIIGKSEHLLKYEAPLKNKILSTKKVWCLGWPTLLSKMPESELIECFSSYYPLSDKTIKKNLSPDAKEKLENTLKFFNYFSEWSTAQYKKNELYSGVFNPSFTEYFNITCHVCDNGSIKRDKICSGCGKDWKDWKKFNKSQS